MFVCRSHYLRLKSTALKLQTWHRSVSNRHHYIKTLNQLRFLQSFLRHKLSKIRNLKQKSAIKIQSAFRMLKAKKLRKLLKKQKEAKAAIPLSGVELAKQRILMARKKKEAVLRIENARYV